jgi:hypothetical protein
MDATASFGLRYVFFYSSFIKLLTNVFIAVFRFLLPNAQHDGSHDATTHDVTITRKNMLASIGPQTTRLASFAMGPRYYFSFFYSSSFTNY